MIGIADVERRVERIRADVGAESLPADGSAAARRLVRWVLRALVTEAVLRDEAARRSLIDDPVDRSSPTDELDPEVVIAVFNAVTDDVVVDEEAVGGYYTANVDRYRRPESRRVRHVLVGDHAAAAALVVEHARSGALPGAVVAEVRRGRFAGPFEDAMFAAAPGDVVGPVRSELGWHVAAVDLVAPAGATPLADVRADIVADLLAAERGRVFDEWLDARRNAISMVAPGYEHPGDPRSPDGVHRH